MLCIKVRLKSKKKRQNKAKKKEVWGNKMGPA